MTAVRAARGWRPARTARLPARRRPEPQPDREARSRRQARTPGSPINAFSLWRNPWSGLGDTFQRGDDAAVGLVIGPLALSWQQVGVVLFAAIALFALVQVARRDDLRGILLASLLLAIAFFVSRRGSTSAISSRRWCSPPRSSSSGRCMAVDLRRRSRSLFFANIYWVYTEDWSFAGRVINPGAFGQPMPQDATPDRDPADRLAGSGCSSLTAVVAARRGRLARRAHGVARPRHGAVSPAPASPAPRAEEWATRPSERGARHRRRCCPAWRGWRATRPTPTCASRRAGSTAATR